MSDVIPFNFRGASVRVVTDEHGNPWFAGKDVCDLLGYTNASKAMNDHCRGVTKRYPILDSLGRVQLVETGKRWGVALIAMPSGSGEQELAA